MTGHGNHYGVDLDDGGDSLTLRCDGTLSTNDGSQRHTEAVDDC